MDATPQYRIDLVDALNAAPDRLATLPAAWECDLATERLRWSAGVFDLFGLPRGSAVDRRATLEQYHPESRALLRHLRGAALATGGSFTFDAQIVRPTGELRWMRLSADVHLRAGKAVTLYGTKRDITAEISRSGM